MAAPPNAFSGHLEKWVLENTKESIFFINIVPRAGCYGEIEERMETAGHVLEENRPALLDGNGYTSTGFVVEEGPVHLKILTTAHAIEHFFTAQYPLSKDDANRLFITYVVCDHNEASVRQPQNIHHERVYARGRIIGISCQDDLMLIRVRRAAVMDLDQICTQSHPPLRFSSTHPVAFDECAMISWPPLRHRTSVKGRVSHPSRSFDDLGRANPVGYRINLMEVEITSEDGSSGAPLMNGNGKVIGVLHGGNGGTFSFFVSLNDMIYFLAYRGVPIRQD